MKEKQKLYRKVVKISENQQEMLNVFLEKWGFVSESEVLRQAIVFFYKKWEPAYLQPSAREKGLEEEQRKAKKIQEMSDREFALEVVKGIIMKHRTGKEVVITLGLGNGFYVTQLDQIKIWANKDNGWFLNYNLEQLAAGVDLQKRIQESQSMLRGPGYDVVFEEGSTVAHETVEN